MRINAASDYHMDVLPGCQLEKFDKNRIRIPDRALDSWVLSNPRGYGDWFLGQVNLVRETLLERALKQEKISKAVFMGKPLQRAVQLIKRFRDIYFEHSEYKDYATSSIVLTTIFGSYYTGEDSIFDTMDKIIGSIRSHVITNPIGRLKVLNPVDSIEDFTDKWGREPKYYEAFKAFSIHVYNQWQILKGQHGVVKESQVLRGLSGDAPFEAAIRHQASVVSDLRHAGIAGFNGGTGNISTVGSPITHPIKKNTFFGE